METVRRILRYLANLEWTERQQTHCRFCDHTKLKNVVYEDEAIIAFDNLILAGEVHWLIAPKKHIRDIESLSKDDIRTLEQLDTVKQLLLQQHYPIDKSLPVLSGFHRGRRRLVGRLFWPDIVSVHHLHLHVIVRPRLLLKIFKYPPWLPLMWKSDKRVMKEVRRRR